MLFSASAPIQAYKHYPFFKCVCFPRTLLNDNDLIHDMKLLYLAVNCMIFTYFLRCR